MYLRGQNWTDSAISAFLKSRPAWVRQRVRRPVPAPRDLVARLRRGFIAFELDAYFDAAKGVTVPLLGAKERRLVRSILQAAARGFLSDPPGVQLYFTVPPGTDKLPRYRCVRGTSSTELWHRW